ncbi:MAG: hypothetical protein HRU11_13405 [Parvularculaceae bacterium]|nr:hypothetical protein [Parvularculaceae bacterium]
MSVDRFRFPIAMAATIGVQSVMALLWVGAASNRLNQLEASMDQMAALEIRAARLEEQSLHLRDALGRIEAKLDYALLAEDQQ